MITLAWFFSLNLSPICIKKDLQLARDYYQALDSVYDVQYAIPLSPTNTHIDTEYHMSSFRHLSISNLAFFFFFYAHRPLMAVCEGQLDVCLEQLNICIEVIHGRGSLSCATNLCLAHAQAHTDILLSSSLLEHLK